MDWQKLLEDIGFVRIEIGDPIDTFGEAGGEDTARQLEVYRYAFRGRGPT